MKFIMRILISTAAVMLTGYLLPERMVHVDGIKTALLVALVLSFLNSVVKPILIVLTIPVTLISLGLFLLVINAGIILLADYFIEGFQVHGFWAALIFSLILSVINALFGNSDNNRNRQNNQYN
jgi:putative membrane protein